MKSRDRGPWKHTEGESFTYKWIDSSGRRIDIFEHSAPRGVSDTRFRSNWLRRNLTTSGLVQGWKLHISVKFEDFDALVEIARPELEKFGGVKFKTARSTDAYKNLIGTNKGKAITIYPRDEQELAEIVRRLEPKLKGLEPGPTPAGELALGNSKMFYTRYGGFFGKWSRQVVNPTTGELEDDPRGKASHPVWVKIPSVFSKLASQGKNLPEI